MRLTHLNLQNWKNFRNVDIALRSRAFLVGANAVGKSNLLDSCRFLRDIANPEGGLQRAVVKRGGVSQIRSLHARQASQIVVEASFDLGDGPPWQYDLEFTQDSQRRPIVRAERVRRGSDSPLLDRPDEHDKSDPNRLSQTALEQVNANKAFRHLQEGLAGIRYLHLVPQIVRDARRAGDELRDPYGSDFIEQIARCMKKTRESRFRKMLPALKIALPKLEKIELVRDAVGIPHLRGLYNHWRRNAGWQAEDQFSDGTLRLFGLLWVLLDGSAPLLLEEPELSLHQEIIRQVPLMIAQMAQTNGRQVLVSTHSTELLREPGIRADEVVMLESTEEDTKVGLAADDSQVRALVANGISMGDAALPRVAPRNAVQLAGFGS